MKHKHKRTRNKEYWLTADATAFLSENFPRPYRLTPQAHNFLEAKSHRQEVDEIIDEYEAENHDH